MKIHPSLLLWSTAAVTGLLVLPQAVLGDDDAEASATACRDSASYRYHNIGYQDCSWIAVTGQCEAPSSENADSFGAAYCPASCRICPTQLEPNDRSVTPTQSCYTSDEDIVVDFTNGSPQPADWMGLFPVGDDSNAAFWGPPAMWVWLCSGDQSHAFCNVAYDQAVFAAANLPPGTYQARLLRYQNQPFAESSSFTVLGAGQSCTGGGQVPAPPVPVPAPPVPVPAPPVPVPAPVVVPPPPVPSPVYVPPPTGKGGPVCPQPPPGDSVSFDSYFDTLYSLIGSSEVGVEAGIQALPIAYNRLVAREFATDIRMNEVGLFDLENNRRLSMEDVQAKLDEDRRNLQDSSLFLLSIVLFSSGQCTGCLSQFTLSNDILGRRRDLVADRDLQQYYYYYYPIPRPPPPQPDCLRLDFPSEEEVRAEYNAVIAEMGLANINSVDRLIEIPLPTNPPSPAPVGKGSKRRRGRF